MEPRDSDCALAQVSQHTRLSVGDLGVGDPMRPRIDHLGVHFDTAHARAQVEVSRDTEIGNVNCPAELIGLPRFPILPLGFQMYAPDRLESGPASNCGSGFVEDRKHRLLPDHRRMAAAPSASDP